MKKKPEASAHTTDPDLAGGNAESSWVVGHNCVYHDRAVAQYRVSIRTPHGWKSYGHFDNLETASYVANVAILVERCEEKYELNKVGEKNKDELTKWRRLSNHADMEKLASDRFKQIQVELQALLEQEKERLDAERAASVVEYNGAKYRRHDGNWYSAQTGERKTSFDSELDRIWRQNKSIASGQSR
jgi:hypothetical protein